jgi:hypothetical protein
MQVSLAATVKRFAHFGRFATLILAPSLAVTLAAFPAHGLSGAVPSVRAVSGANQQTTYTASFAKPLTVWVSDPASERSLAGIRVNFAASAGLRLNDSFATTDEHGLASVMVTGLEVGQGSVKAEIAGHPGAAVSFDNLVVNKAVLTIVPVDLQSTVGVIPPITEYTIQGFVDGDNEDTAQISGVPVLTTIATESSPDANYAIKGGVGSLTSPKYTFKPGFGALVLRGTGKSSRLAESATPSTVVPSTDGAPVVQSAIPSAKPESPAATTLGTVHKANVLPSIEIARPAPLLPSSVHQAVSRTLSTKPESASHAVVSRGVLGQPTATPSKQSNLAGEFVQGVHSALPNATQDPVSPKASTIRKALNPPTQN